MSCDAARFMDHLYARQRHIYDLTRKYYLLGRDGLIRDLDAPPGGCVLEIGCGTARNLVAIARRYPGTACCGVDISSVMLETASRAIARNGLGTRVRVAQGDAASFDPLALFGLPSFDRVVISYALSMIPSWREVLRHASSLVAPEGSLHVVDFGDQAWLPRGFRTLLEAWLARFHVTPRSTLGAEVERLADLQGLCVTTQKHFRGYAISARLARGGCSPS